jgi:biopolymer transport protein ExbB/TolQ
MEILSNQIVGVSQQIQNPWQLMVSLVAVIIVVLAAIAWAAYKLTARSFVRDDQARDQLVAISQSHAEEVAKLREEHGTELKEILRDNHEVMRQLEQAIENNTRAIDRLSERLNAARSSNS